MHLCGGEIKSFALYTEASDCGIGDDVNAISCEDEPQLKNEHCCENHQVVMEAVSQYRKEIGSLVQLSSFDQPLFVNWVPRRDDIQISWSSVIQKIPLPPRDINIWLRRLTI